MLAKRPSLLTLTLVSLAIFALFLLSPLPLLSSAEAISPLPVETSVLSDDYNDNRLDLTRWRYSNASSASIVLEQNQRLEIPLRPNAAGYYGIQTLGTHDLRERTVSVDLLQATSQGGWAETYFQIKRDESNYYHMSVGGGSFVLDAWTNGVRDRTVLSYDAVNQRFWRFRHDVASNTMNFETSANGTAWTTQKIVGVGFQLDSMYAVLLAGAWGTGNSTPGAAIFDNFTIKSSSVNQPPTVTLTKPAHNATFGRGSTITLAATAADADGGIQRVEFFEGPNKLGEDFTAPYSIPWGNVKAGNYFITARATDVSGAMTTSNAAYIAVSNAPSVTALLVIANPANMPASDGVIKARLENLGFTVTVKDAVSVTAADATNKSLVFISETVVSADLTTRFRDVAVPVISAEPQIFDDMMMTGPTLNTDYGVAGGQTQVRILDPSHPLAAGCTGTVSISTLASGASWGKPAASAMQVASLAGDSTAKTIFAYESGAMMNGMQAPARRVGLVHGNDAFNSLTETGGALFDAAVRWATTTPSFVQYPRDNTPAAIPGTVQVELFDEGGDGTAYHDLTPGNDASTNYRYPTDVDAWDGGIGYVQAGEWLEYTVNVTAAGAYRADVSVAAAQSGGTFHIEFDGLDVTGPMMVPNTGSWGAYQNVSKSGINLSAGQHVMRIVMDTGGPNGFVANFDSVKFLVPTSTTELAAYWKMDEASGTVLTDSAGSNTGTLSGPTRVTGRVGVGALNFDGVDDRVSIASSAGLASITNNFTVSFWVNPRSTHQIDPESVTGVAGVGGQRWAFEPINKPDPDAGAGISVATNGVSVYEHAPGYMPATLVYPATLSGWTHVAVVYENKQPRLYINGALVRTGLRSPRANVYVQPPDIGGMVYGYLDGQMDDMRIYSRALNSAEVSALATAEGDNALTEFSLAQNPNGVWSYGYRTSAGAPFKLYPTHDQPSGNVGTWYDTSIPDTWHTPQISHGAGSPLVHLHPGPQGQMSILRWTAPSATTVNISGRFENMNNATTDVHVVHNSSAALFDGAINGAGSVAPFSIRKTVAAGDTLDFVVGWGSNGTYYSDSTGLVLNIAPDAGSPYDDTKTAISGTIEAENFNNGGEGIAYHDTTAGTHGVNYNTPAPNPPTTYRQPTDVDIYQSINYNNGYLVLMQAGDWMKYTIDVSATGNYSLELRTAWGDVPGGMFHIEIDGVDKTGPIQIPDSAWTMKTITGPNLALTAGRHTMRVVADSNASNGSMGDIDFIRLTLLKPNNSAFVSQSVPASMIAGQTYNVSVTMRNTGTNTWTTAGYYNLGSQNPQDNATWRSPRVALAGPVAQNANATFNFTVTAPATPGNYNFQWKMVQDTVEWFGALSSNVVVNVIKPNQLPKANAGASQFGLVGQPIQFSGDGSSDPDGTIASYSWNFGDGQTASVANPAHTYSAGGNYAVNLTVTDNQGATATATITVAVIEATQSSYLNNSKVPGTIQAEDFDNGGPEVAYHDDSPGNQGGSGTYRPGEAVDIENNTASNAGYAVGWTRAGEWLEYVVEVADADNYKFEAQVASPIDGGTGGVFHLEIDGGNVTGPFTVPNTGSAWATVSKSGIRLSAGPHVLRLVMESGGSTGYVGRFDYFKFTASQTPYGGTARSLPGTVQAEDFDNGEQGTSYSDKTPGNQGGAYRSTDADIWTSSEGPALGWGQKGEWWDYTVDVSQTGSYTFAARVASPGAGAKFHLELDEFTLTEPITVPATGSRDTWQTVQTSVKLPAGRHILRLVVDDAGAGGEVCFNSFTVTVSTPPPGPPAEAVLGTGEPYPNVDYTAVGVGNLIHPSNNGTLALPFVKNVKKAFLFWWGVPFGILRSENIVFADVKITGFGVAAAHHGEKYFGAESVTYRADVTNIVSQSVRNGVFNFPITTTTSLGASLIVLWDDGNQNNNRDITLFVGNDGNRVFGSPFTFDPEGWDSFLPGINYTVGSGPAIVQLHVAEGERQRETPLIFSRFIRQIVYPRPTDPFDFFGPDLFQGRSVPPGSNSVFDPVSLWDIVNFDVTSILANGQNDILITAGLDRDTLFLALAVVNVPHPAPPTVTITDEKPDTNNRVPGNLAEKVQQALIGDRLFLRANGNTSSDKYHWDFTGPVTFVEGRDSRSVSFETDDGGDQSDPKKTVYTVTAKVTFTNEAGQKAESTVTINVRVPTLPKYDGTPGASTVEVDKSTTEKNTFIIWHMGSSDPEHRQPAMTFNARAQIPDGPYLSDLDKSFITFSQAINLMRKVRNLWGKEGCKTTRSPQVTAENVINSGWRHDGNLFVDRVNNFPGATKNFDQSAAVSGIPNARLLSIDFQEGVEGIRFHNIHPENNNALADFGDDLGTNLIDVDAAFVDDRFETSVMYRAGSFSRPLGTIKWQWGGEMVFDTTRQGAPFSQIPMDGENANNPVDKYYVFNTNTTKAETQHEVSKTVVAGVINSPQIPWEQCPEGFGKPQPTGIARHFHTIIENRHGFVQLLYREALGKSPFARDFLPNGPSDDRIGYHFWASKMTKNGFNDNAIDGERVHTAMAFLFAKELADRYQDDENLKGLSKPHHTPEFNKAFVWACYKVFLQRNPGEPGEFTLDNPEKDPIKDMDGYNFWVGHVAFLEAQNVSDDYPYFETAHAFLESIEYNARIRANFFNFMDDISEQFDSPIPVFPVPPQ